MFKRKTNNGITLIALVITIIVLLILARSSNKHINRRQWNTRKGSTSKRKNKRSRRLRILANRSTRNNVRILWKCNRYARRRIHTNRTRKKRRNNSKHSKRNSNIQKQRIHTKRNNRWNTRKRADRKKWIRRNNTSKRSCWKRRRNSIKRTKC